MRIPVFSLESSLPPGMRFAVLLVAGATIALADDPARGDESGNAKPMRVVRYGEPVEPDTSAAPAAPAPAPEAHAPASSAARPAGAPSRSLAPDLRRVEGSLAKPTTGRLFLRGMGGAFLGGTLASVASSLTPGGASMVANNTDNDVEVVAFLMTMGATGIGYMIGAVAGVASTDSRLSERGSVGWTAVGSAGGLVVGTLVASGFIGLAESTGEGEGQNLIGFVATTAFFTGPVVGAVIGYRLSARDLPVSVAVPPEGGVSVRWKVALR